MPSNPLTDENWAQEVTAQITTFVGTVRDQTTNRAIKVARIVGWGLLLAIVGAFLALMLLIGILRGLQVLLGLLVSDPRSVYISYFAIGGILFLAAMYVLKKRKPTR